MSRAEAVADERQRIARAIELLDEWIAGGELVAWAMAVRDVLNPANAPESTELSRAIYANFEADQAAGSVPVATPDEKADALLGKHCAYISRAVTASYPAGMDPELVMRRRVGKIFVEAGELGDAIEGWTGENPRKGVYATREDVIKELIDCASASLCAIEYMTGDLGLSVGIVARQVIGNAQRLSESIPDRCQPAVSPVATPTEPDDPTYGRIDPDIQRAVDALEPESIGSRVAMENTLQARRDAASPVPAGQPVDEVVCPTCGTTIRARMSDTRPSDEPAKEVRHG